MRLTCPNCGAEYDVPEGLVPPAGRHVQCTACHTRWFMRGPERAELSEDEILSKLETRGARPPAREAMPSPTAPAATSPAAEPARAEASEPIPFPRAAKPAPVEAAPAAGEVAGPASVAGTPDRLPPPARVDQPTPAPEKVAPRPPGDAAPGLVNLRPSAGPEAEAANAPPAGGTRAARAEAEEPRETEPRPEHRSSARPRIDIAEAHSAPPPPVRRARRFLPGFILTLLIAGLAFEIYYWRDPLAAQVPAAAPAIHGYADGVDAAREWLRDRLEAAGLVKPS